MSADENNRIYREIQPITLEAAEAALHSEEPRVRIEALIDAAFTLNDWNWVQRHCLEFVGHQDPWVRNAGCICLGHIARIHRKLDLNAVVPVLQALLDDPERFVKGAAQDTLDGIEAWQPIQA